jgi:tetratricopeptide (TPR) repeat protein
MKKIKVCIARFGSSVFLFLCCLTWIGVFAQTAVPQFRNSITGFVFDPQRNPVSHIPVEVLNEVNQSLQRTRTNSSGRFFFSGLSAGKFSVRVMPYGTNFEEQTQEVEIVNFVRSGSSTSESAQKDFYLRLRRDAKEANAVTGTLFAQEIPREAQKFYSKAISEFESNREEVGIQELLNAIKVFPEYFLALERLGRVYIKQQKYDYARAVFIKTVSVNQRSFTGWYGLSYASYALGQPELAVEAAQNASKLEPTSIEAKLILGISLRRAKRYQEAEKILLQAKKLAKGQAPDVHWNLALLYNHNLKRYKDAADELELYLKAKPDETKADNIKKLIAQLREKSASK